MTTHGHSTASGQSPSIGTSIRRSLRRRWSALSNAEQGIDANEAHTEQQIVEEIDEIKRYEVGNHFRYGLRLLTIL